MRLNPLITVITPTTGKSSLYDLMRSINNQNVPIHHILLWDDKKEGEYNPESIKTAFYEDKFYEDKAKNINHNYTFNSIDIMGTMVMGEAYGSALRAVGLMAANTEYVMFADDDVIWEDEHAVSLLEAVKGKKWAFCKRRIWSRTPEGNFEFLGVDNFESVGEDAKTPYKMVDNNCLIITRRLGTSAAVLYRETTDYDDDRLMYSFLKKYGGEPGKTEKATINQTCPDKLIDHFERHCTR